MNKDDIKSILADGITPHAFKYTKNDGTERIANGTLNVDLISKYIPITIDSVNVAAKRTVNPNIVNYFDTDKQGWRSFNIGNFIEFLNQE